VTILDTAELSPGVTAELYPTAHRPSGRRIIVRGKEDDILFDTRDHVDYGNARNALDRWLSQLPKGN
jgi:hypothetical protein